jgi:hypothetical protein
MDGEGNGAGEQGKIGGRKGEVWSLISDEGWWVVERGSIVGGEWPTLSGGGTVGDRP